MSSFQNVALAGQVFSEGSEMMGETFTYQNQTLRGVFDQVVVDWQFADFSFRKITALICVTSKPQWSNANVVPANRQVITYNGVSYPIQAIAGLDTPGESSYTLTCFKNT